MAFTFVWRCLALGRSNRVSDVPFNSDAWGEYFAGTVMTPFRKGKAQPIVGQLNAGAIAEARAVVTLDRIW